MSPDASLNDFLGAQNARRRSRPGLPEWSSGPPEWSEDCARSGRGSGPGSFRSGRSCRVRPGCEGSSAGSARLVLEVLLWLVGRYSKQGVMLHVCKMVLRHRLFRMTRLKVGARRALRAVGGAWRDSATMCYSGPGAGRSAGVLPGPVALRALEVASYRHSRRQGQGAPRTCRCIETKASALREEQNVVREHHAPVGALRHAAARRRHRGGTGQGAPRTCRCIETRLSPMG